MPKFLDASALGIRDVVDAVRTDVKYNNIRFVFPEGFSDIPLIEECRAMNALDLSEPDNFDLMFDITMQLLSGKPVEIYYIEDDENKQLLDKFLVTDRYMNLRGVDIIDEYPVLVNWLVEFVAGALAKKFPSSLQKVRETMDERKERMKSLKKLEEARVTTSPRV